MLERVSPRIEAMWKQDLEELKQSRTIEFISVVGARREFLPALYPDSLTFEDLVDRQNHGKKVSSKYEMNYLFLECMNKLSAPIETNRFISKLSNNELVGQLLHEAFRNTAEHAYLTIDGKIPKKGLRSISFHIISGR